MLDLATSLQIFFIILAAGFILGIIWFRMLKVAGTVLIKSYFAKQKSVNANLVKSTKGSNSGGSFIDSILGLAGTVIEKLPTNTVDQVIKQNFLEKPKDKK